MKPVQSVRFSKEEAQARLGCKVQAAVWLSDIAAGTGGRVVGIDEIEKDDFELIIEWDARVDGKFQHDWFTKGQYERCLIDEPN